LKPAGEFSLQNARVLAFTPAGKELAVASAHNFANDRFKSRVFRWTFPEREPLASLEWLDGTIIGLRYTADGRYLAGVTDEGVGKFWRHADGVAGKGFERHTPTEALAVARTGDVATAVWDQDSGMCEIARFSMTAGKQATPLPRYPIRFGCVAFTPDGSMIAAGNKGAGNVRWESLAAIRLWETKTGKEEAVLLGHTGWILDLAFAANGKELLTASKDGTVRSWNVADFAARKPEEKR